MSETSGENLTPAPAPVTPEPAPSEGGAKSTQQVPAQGESLDPVAQNLRAAPAKKTEMDQNNMMSQSQEQLSNTPQTEKEKTSPKIESLRTQLELVRKKAKDTESTETPQSVEQILENIGAETYYQQIFQELVAEETDQSGADLTPEKRAELELQAKTRAEAMSKSKMKKFKEDAVNFVADFANGVIERVVDLDFDALVDLFLSYAGASSRFDSRLKNLNLRNSEDAKIVSDEKMMNHFKSKKKLVETLNIFYENAGKLKLEKPQELRKEEDYKEMSDADLKKVLIELGGTIEVAVKKENIALLEIFEQALGKSMGESDVDLKKIILHDTAFQTLIHLGSERKTQFFDELVKKFVDVDKPEEKQKSVATPIKPMGSFQPAAKVA